MVVQVWWWRWRCGAGGVEVQVEHPPCLQDCGSPSCHLCKKLRPHSCHTPRAAPAESRGKEILLARITQIQMLTLSKILVENRVLKYSGSFLLINKGFFSQ